MNNDLLLKFWYRALEEELGIVIEVNETMHFRNLLYTARRTANDPTLNDLVAFAPASNDRIFLVRRSVELDP